MATDSPEAQSFYAVKQAGNTRAVRDLSFKVDGNGAWTDLFLRHEQGKVIWVPNSALKEVAGFESDPFATAPVVSIRIDLPDGRTAIAHMTMESFCQAADVFRAHYLTK